MKRAVAVAALAVLASCKPATPSPAASPRLHAGADELIPAGLDLVVRIDVARLRRTLGDAALARATAFASGSVARALTSASTVFLGFRGPPDGGLSDVVIAATGSFGSFDPARDDATAWREAERTPTTRRFVALAPAERAAPAWLFVEDGRLLLAASAAEVDAAERHLASPRKAALDPPADGVVGIAARVRAIPDATLRAYPEVAAALVGVTSLRGTLDAEGGLVRVDVIAAFRAENDATRAERTIRRVIAALEGAGGAAAVIAKVATVERAAPTSFVLRVRLPANDLAALTPTAK